MAEITKTVFKIGNKEIEMSVDEAKELKTILGSMFGENITVIREYSDWYKRPWDWWKVTYDTGGTYYLSSGA